MPLARAMDMLSETRFDLTSASNHVNVLNVLSASDVCCSCGGGASFMFAVTMIFDEASTASDELLCA